MLLEKYLTIQQCHYQPGERKSTPTDVVPRESLRGGISLSFLEPSYLSWSHFVGIYCQKLTSSLLNRLLKYPHEGPCVVLKEALAISAEEGKELRALEVCQPFFFWPNSTPTRNGQFENADRPLVSFLSTSQGFWQHQPPQKLSDQIRKRPLVASHS